MLAFRLRYLACILSPIISYALARSTLQKKPNSLDVTLPDSILKWCMTILSASINICTGIEQQSNDVNVASNGCNMERSDTEQTSCVNFDNLVSESDKIWQVYNLIQKALQGV